MINNNLLCVKDVCQHIVTKFRKYFLKGKTSVSYATADLHIPLMYYSGVVKPYHEDSISTDDIQYHRQISYLWDIVFTKPR